MYNTDLPTALAALVQAGFQQLVGVAVPASGPTPMERRMGQLDLSTEQIEGNQVKGVAARLAAGPHECSFRFPKRYEEEQDNTSQYLSHEAFHMTRRGNGEGSIRLRQDGRWEARYTLPNGYRRSIMGKTRSAVREKLTEALRNLDRGIIAPRDERQTLGDYLDRWLVIKRPTVEPGYWRRLEESVRIYSRRSAECP
jgi:hypothetical protein